MIFTLTDRHYNVLDAYETDDYLIGQYVGTILETLEINVLVKSLNAEHWVEGNYIMCQDKKGKKRWFTIYDCEDSHSGDVKSLFCYSGTIDIVAEDAAPISASEAKPFKWYFDTIFYDTGIELGINEISDLTRKLEFTSENASNAEMLQYVLNGFDNAEASLDVEFDGATPTKLVLNVYKRIGNEEPQAILSDEDDSLTSLDRKGSISDLATCINPTGAEDENGNPITLLGKYYEEKDENGNILYYSPVDSPRVFSVVARRDFYVQLPGKSAGEFDGYINRRYTSQATTQDMLWQESLAQLKKIDHVAVTYEANGYIDCSIGDNVQIVSHEMKPPVMIAARTIEYKFNDDDPSRNVYKFGNYVELTSNLDELAKIVSDLKQKLLIVTVVASAGTVFKNGTGETDLTAVTILGGKEVDTDGLFYNYVWAKYDKNGNFVGATSGKKITVYAQNIDEKETYIVTVENEGAKSIGQITVTNVNDGEQGPPGKSSYTHVAYANSADGRTDFSLTDSNREYIGMYVDDSPTNSTDPTKYKWTLVKGADGAQGIQGPPGADGRTPYLHIAYANSADGLTGFSTTDSANKLYIGQYTDFTPTDSTDPTKYSWTLIKGDKGEQGPAGKGVSSIQEQYYLSTSATAQIGGSWVNTPPAWVDGRYMWTRSVITYTDGTTVTTNPVCVTGAKGPTGETGTGIQSVDVMYYLSTSATSLSGGSWSTTAPTWQDGKYMWSKTVTKYTNGNVVESAPACITGAKGATGPAGRSVTSIVEEYYYSTSPTAQVGGSWSTTYPAYQAGKYLWTRAKTTFSDGTTSYTSAVCVTGTKGADGQTLYTWVKYADDDSGNGMSDSPNGKRYLGLAHNKTTPTESTNPNDYSWSPLYDNVKVDGRNFIRNADLVDNSNYWSFNGLNSYAYVENAYMNVRGLKTVRTGTSNAWAGMISTRGVKVEPGEQVTLSVWYKVEVEADGLFIEVEYYGTANHTGTRLGTGNVLLDRSVGDWRYGFGTFTVPNYSGDIYAYFRVYVVQSGTVTYCMPKLERGNIPTGFSIAQEDITERTEQAKRDAQNAQSTADGKNTVFYQATAPSTTGRKVNDLWFDTDDGYKPYYFNGSSWIPAPFGNAAIANLDAGKITTGYLNAARIAAKSIDVSKLNVSTLSAITANLGNITAGNINGVNISGVTITGSTIISDGVWQTIQSRVQLGNGVITVGDSSANNTVSPVGFIVEQDGGRLHHEFGADGILFYGSAADVSKAGIYVQYESYGNGISMVLAAENYTAVTSKFWVRNNEARFQSTENFIDPEPNVRKAIKASGGISTDGLYANTGSVSKNAIATNGKIFVGGEGIELSWVGGTPYIDFSRRAGVDFDMRLILETDSGLAIKSSDNIVRHKFYANGTKSGGSIEVDGKNFGMSPIDSPQILLETIEFDVPLTSDGTKVLLDSRFAKAVNHKFAVFPNNGEVIEKGADYFIIAGEGLADIRIVGERVGYAGVYFDDMTMEGVA